MENENLINDTFHRLNKIVEGLYKLSLNIKFLTNLKGCRIIGQCKKVAKNSYIIRLHTKLLEEFGQEYLDDVLTHELAHAVQMEIYPKSKPHSREWKNIVETLSQKKYSTKNKIDYRLNEFSKNKKKFVYICKCMEHHVSSIIHKRISQKRYFYNCKKCKEVLIHKDINSVK